YLDTRRQGEIVSTLIADVDQFTDGLLMGFSQFFTGIVTIIGTLGFMFWLNWRIALVVVVLTPLSLLVAKFIATHSFRLFARQSEERARQTAIIDEMIGALSVVKAFGHEKANMQAFDEIGDALEEASVKATFLSSLTNPGTRFVNNLVYASVALTGSLVCIAGRMTVGGLTIFLSYANQYTKPFNEISGVVTELQNALACAGRVFDLIDEKRESADPADAEELNGLEGRIDIESVDFSYSRDKELIRNFSLAVAPGERVAIVGPTGSGKTTIINLLMRFYDVDAGRICVEGKDIRQLRRSALRAGYGMVLQETWLRRGTVRENITLGRDGFSDMEIEAAAKAAHAHSFIRRLPQGYDTLLEEDGGSLSQGQKQLLCIARVMLALPPMLILDEATSSIDTMTEMRIQSAFQRMMQGRTSFIVAHRLSTIREADRILVLRDGHVVEQGSHEELLAQGGFYNELYQSQFAS
ncbi:MAG: ABC transporter ATP-binding protein, partial [Butyrivibrio sp.]|nr:ABC transporter ATP-binding protein [Butyrivibrio sp.]